MTNRELDALVASRVVGELPEIIWIARDDDDKPDAEAGAYANTSTHFDSPFRHKDQIEQWIMEHPTIHGRAIRLGKWEHYKPYSSDIAAAWQVVEKMRTDGYGYTLMDEPAHVCVFNVGDEERVRVKADTAPRAICLAALRAVGVEVEEKEERC